MQSVNHCVIFKAMKTQRNISITMILIGLALLCYSCMGAQLDDKFIRALHLVESSGRTGPIIGDHGKALGPFQIHYSYWKDANIAGKYQDCSNYNYSVKVLTAWMNRYAAGAIVKRDYQTLARRHNGGPRGEQNTQTLHYWKKVQKFL